MHIKLQVFGISLLAHGEIGSLIVSPPERPWRLASLDASLPRIVNALHTDWMPVPAAGEPHFEDLTGYRGQIAIDGWVGGQSTARVEIGLWDETGAEVFKMSRNTECYGINIGTLSFTSDFTRGRTAEEIRRRAFRDQFRHDPNYPR